MIAAKEPRLCLLAVALCCRGAAKQVRWLSNLVCGQISRRSAALLWRDPSRSDKQANRRSLGTAPFIPVQTFPSSEGGWNQVTPADRLLFKKEINLKKKSKRM